MDQLLNSAAGYPYSQLTSNNDNLSPDERMRQGCLGGLFYLIITVAFFLLMACFSSCATSKSLNQTTTVKTDSTITATVTATEVQRTDSTIEHSIVTTETTATVADSSAVNDTETTTEHITETITPDGSVMRTIDRTSNKSHRDNSTHLAATHQLTDEEYTKLLISYLDSVAQSRDLVRDYHAQYNDSIINLKHTPSFYEYVMPEVINIAKILIVLLFIYCVGKDILLFLHRKNP